MTRSEERPTKSFLIGRPSVSRESPTGRCTKGYIAFNLDDKELIFLKDQWRADVPRARKEIDTYAHLKKHDMRFVATFIAGGDVQTKPGDESSTQETTTQRHSFINNTKKENPVPRVHVRIVTKEIGRSLEDYTN